MAKSNTPSQTEVKIISCIPVDVTDLQQKILHLEKQLHEAKKCSPKIKEKNNVTPPPAIRRSSCCDPDIKSSITNSLKQVRSSLSNANQKVSTTCCECPAHEKTSNISYSYPLETNTKYIRGSSENSYAKNKRKFINNERVKCLFRKGKRKKATAGCRGNTQFIYFAQTPNNTKNDIKPINDIPNINIEVLSSSYLSQVYRKFYDPKQVINEFSDTSHFSQPVCRDLKYNFKHLPPYESDVCSCCHGQFTNLDYYMKDLGINSASTDTYDKCKVENGNMAKIANDMFDFGDMIPVKEKPTKNKNNFNMKPEDTNIVQPEAIRIKQRSPITVNYEIGTPVMNRRGNKTRMKATCKNTKRKQKPTAHINQDTAIGTSKSSSLDYCDVYTKPTEPKTSSMAFKRQYVKDHITADTEPEEKDQNTKLKTILVDYTKTENTLKEIKCILQTVLTTIKTNANMQNKRNECVKKDAVVQKGQSQNNVQGASTFLHSFTYNNPYNASPYVLPYTRPDTQYCFPNVSFEPFKCMQNYPVFVPTVDERRAYACYHKHNSCRLPHLKDTINISTNTEKELKESNSKETEKLIKEIYKSVAINMDYNSKDNTGSYSDDLKSTIGESMTGTPYVDTSSEAPTRLKKDVAVEALLSAVSDATESKIIYTATSSNSRYQCEFTEHDTSNTEASHFASPQYMRLDDATDEYLYVPISDADSNEVVVLDDKTFDNKKKKGTIKNMLRSVNVFKKKMKQAVQAVNTSDTDDVGTVYSEKSTNVSVARGTRLPGINFVRAPANKNKTSTDQENGREWGEPVAAREDRVGQVMRVMTPRPWRQHAPRSLYGRDYEARSALVERDRLKNILGAEDVNGTRVAPKVNLSWLNRGCGGCGGCARRWKEFILEN